MIFVNDHRNIFKNFLALQVEGVVAQSLAGLFLLQL